MNKPLNAAIKEIRLALLSLHREGYGKEDPMSPGEVAEMDSWVQERVDEILAIWVKTQVADALGVTEWLKATQEGE